MSRSAFGTLLAAALAATPAAAMPRAQSMRTALPNATIPGTVCSTQPKLVYSQGPLIQNVKVVTVFYSPGYKYKSMIEAYFTAITKSAYFDWLMEYNSPDGKYKIGRGSWVKSFEDANPAPAANAAIQAVNPATYLKSLLAANKLPPPDDNTMYMLFFPDRIDPTDGSDSSCVQQNGTYCAYHDSFTDANGHLVRYGVMPDMDAMGCSGGCGPTGFASVTDVSAHELIEAVTDPDNGTGWLDNPTDQNNSCGEIGDICAVGGTMETETIAGFAVQKEWSNKFSSCIGVSPNAFTVTATPAMVSVPAGGTATVALALALVKPTGMAEMTTLAATGTMGVTATLMPASAMSSNGTSTLTVSAPASAAPGTTATVTVTATGQSVTTSVDVPVTVVAAPDMAMPPSTGGNGGSGGTGGSGGANGLQGASGGCSVVAGGSIGGAWALAALVLIGFAFRRRRV